MSEQSRGKIEESKNKEDASRKHMLKHVVCIMVGIVLLLVIGFVIGVYMVRTKKELPLSNASNNVRVTYQDPVSDIKVCTSLVYLSEEEIFHKYNTAIFKGAVIQIDNIVIDYNGYKDYRAIAQIEVETVYRGEMKTGDTVSVLLPCPIMEGMWVEDTDIISTIREGTTGIFMPVIYDSSYVSIQNGATLLCQDICDFGILDGVRFAFLDTEQGLYYSSSDFPSIPNATTLDEVETYVRKMIDD